MSKSDYVFASLNPEQQTKLRRALSELDDSLLRRSAENELIRETVKRLHEETQVPVKVIRRMAVAYHKGTFEMEVQLDQDFHAVYEQVLQERTTPHA